MTNHRPFFVFKKPTNRFCAVCENWFFVGELGYRTPDGKVYCLRCLPYEKEIGEGRLKVVEVKK